MAEASVSEVCCTVTLTYAPRDDLADKILHPRHFQLFMKMLRNAGHKVRYLVCGEYGDIRARAHFHALLFFTDLRPLDGAMPCYIADYPPGTLPENWGAFCREIPQKRMVHIREWPHGHITVDWSASEKSARYVCKYLLASDKNNAWFSLSKKPALGAEWFARKAAKARELGVLPSSFEYLPPGGSKDRPYLMTGATRRDYLNAITTNSADIPRMSEWVQKTFEKCDKRRRLEILEALPVELSDKALMDDFDLRSDQHAIKMAGEEFRRRMFLEDLLAASPSGILRFYRGKWMPDHVVDFWKRRDKEDEEAGKTSSLWEVRIETDDPKDCVEWITGTVYIPRGKGSRKN
ncbi:rolling circle replication-associated protein [Pseudogemmobacter humi]|nr:hypothetical protein [Pseudogemmobacter humi]